MGKQRIAVLLTDSVRVAAAFGCHLRDAGVALTGLAVGVAGALHSEITWLLAGV
jgi:hypothetical protein